MLLAVVAEKISPFFPATEEAVTMIDAKEESKDGKELEKEKAKSNKEKLFKEYSLSQTINDDRSLHVLDHIYFKYSVYLSLPEIPPDKA